MRRGGVGLGAGVWVGSDRARERFKGGRRRERQSRTVDTEHERAVITFRGPASTCALLDACPRRRAAGGGVREVSGRTVQTRMHNAWGQCELADTDRSGQQQQQQRDELCHWQVHSRLLPSLVIYTALLVSNKVETHTRKRSETFFPISAPFFFCFLFCLMVTQQAVVCTREAPLHPGVDFNRSPVPRNVS